MRKINRSGLGTVDMIWEAKRIFWPYFLTGQRNSLRRQMNGKARQVKQAWKWLFSLDFEKGFTVSFFKLLFIWNPIWTFLMSLAYEGYSLQSILFRWSWNFFEATIGGLFAMGMLKFFISAEKIWTARHSRPRVSRGTGWYLLFLAFMVPLGLYLALHLMVFGINKFYAGDPITPEFHWKYYGNEIFWGWMLLLVFFLYKSWEDLRDTARVNLLRAEELEKERLLALLTKLKDQMNPHFLFNTLNTVASLIPADPPKAEQVVIKLSSLFQSILEATRKTDHSLKRELEFCRDYLDIEKARFGPRLAARFKTEKGLEIEKILVPVLLLQPLVENAVKHGISSRAKGGHIWIGASTKSDSLVLTVEDDGVGFGNSPYAGSGTALENCRKRLELGFGNAGRMEISPRKGGGAKILLHFPLITAELLNGGKK